MLRPRGQPPPRGQHPKPHRGRDAPFLPAQGPGDFGRQEVVDGEGGESRAADIGRVGGVQVAGKTDVHFVDLGERERWGREWWGRERWGRGKGEAGEVGAKWDGAWIGA